MNRYASVRSTAELRRLQRAFAEIIRRPLTAGDVMRSDARSTLLITPSAQLTPHDRLELYAQQYWWRIRDSFYEDFPGVRRVLGEEEFARVAQAYLTACPSRSYTLRNLGAQFPAYLKRSRALAPRTKALAAEVALIEWDKIDVFDAASAQPISAATAATAKIALSSTVKLRCLRFPAHRVFRGAQLGSDHEHTSNVKSAIHRRRSRSSAVTVAPGTTYLATHRYNHKIFFKELDYNEFQLLSLIDRHRSIPKAIAAWKPKRIPMSKLEHTIASYFTEWGALGWLTLL